MFSKNVLFLQILFFQSIFVLKTHEYQYKVVSTTEEPSKLYKKPDQIFLVLELVNEIKSQLEEMKKEILTLKEHNIQTHLQKEKEHLTILKNQFAEYKNWSEKNIQIQWQKFEEKQNNYTKIYLENLFEQHNNIVNEMKSQFETTRKEIFTMKKDNDEFRNWSKNNIQIQWQKFEQKQRDQQSLQNNFTKTYLENSHDNLQKLIESMLQNQTKQHNNIVNGMKSQFETTRKEIFTIKKDNDEFRNWSKNNIQTEWQKFEQKQKDQNNYTKTYLENLHYDLQKLIESMLQNQTTQQNNIVNEMKSQFETTRKEILTMKEDNNQFDEFKNCFKNNIQTEWQKFGQKQKEQQLVQINFTKIYLENLHYDLQKLIQSMLQNQYRQHNNIVNEMKSQFETTRKEILTLKENNIQFDVYKKSLETKIDLLISHSNDTKTYMKNVNNTLAELTPPKSCIDVQKSGKTLSGIYTIWPDFSPRGFDVWCDMETRDGGWTYVINRFDGSVDFNLNWTDYKNGFGDLDGEFWLGLEHLYILTKNKPNELLIELVDQNLTKAYAQYKQFSIGDEGEGYPIKIIKEYSGDTGDDFSDHSGLKFSTADRDQDTTDQGNCAEAYGGGFWYSDCYYCLFTGIYNGSGIECRSFRGFDVRLKQVKMMVKS